MVGWFWQSANAINGTRIVFQQMVLKWLDDYMQNKNKPQKALIYTSDHIQKLSWNVSYS